MGYFPAHDCWRACSPAQRRFAAVQHHASRCLFSPVCCPAADRKYPRRGSLCANSAAPFSVPPVTAIRMYRPGKALRTATAYDKALAAGAKLVVDVGMGYFRAHDCWRACSPARRRDSRTLLDLASQLPPCGQLVTKVRFRPPGF